MIEVGQTIGNYRITAKLGEGGMGVVFLAEHPVIGRKVALKAIHPELSRNPEVVSRFMTEAKSVNQIGNEHIVEVTDFGNTPGGEFYFIMEFLQGESLSDRLRRERLFDPIRALGIAAQVADALAASHSHGIVHRDLKPENIFLINRGNTRDFVKVLDFGLAKLTQGEEKVSHKTRTGSVMGTPYYMAPEQCEGRAGIDHRADIYSLGVILFEMLTGSVPFGGEGYGEIIVKHLTQQPPAPRDLNPMLTTVHEQVVMKALVKTRDTRFQTMDEFRAALLDPEGWVVGNPRPPLPTSGPPTPHSGAIALNPSQIRSRGPISEIRKGPIPSTFRHGAGELIDDELRPPRSKRSLVMGGLAGAAVLAAVAAFALTRGGPGDASQPAAAVTTDPKIEALPDPVPARLPPVPETVRMTFSSEPDGAEVVLKSSGKKLGVTPFESDITFGKTMVTVIFRKTGHQEKERTFTPERSSLVGAVLLENRREPPPEANKPAAQAAPTITKPKAATARPTTPRVRRPAPAVAPPPASSDEDEVLRPSL